MADFIKFNRMEVAGSLGDLGTLLPLAIGMILINGLNPMGLLLGVGLFYICSGLYFRVTCPVEPMKVIGAYAVATGITAIQIQASCLWIFLFLIIIGGTDIISVVGRYIPKPVIRGVQLSTGVLLVSQGVRLMLGTSKFQMMRQTAEPYLIIQEIGWLPIGLIIGLLLGFLTLLLIGKQAVSCSTCCGWGGFACRDSHWNGRRTGSNTNRDQPAKIVALWIAFRR